MKIMLACSGGGHLRQLLQLCRLREMGECILVSQRTPLSLSAAEELPTRFLPDVALGKLKHSPGAWWAWLVNFVGSLRILLTERPDVVVSTGAGTALNLLLLSKLLGRKVVFLETFAHVQTPSLTGSLVGPRADLHVVQWEPLLQRYPKATLASPLRTTGNKLTPKPDEIQQVMVTVGTHGPFDRLVKAVENLVGEGVLPKQVVAQVAPGGYQSPLFRCFESCSQDEMVEHLNQSRLLITHAGTGSILSGLKAGCQVLAFARDPKLGEHYDDHQKEILQAMQERGAILGSDRVEDLPALVAALPQFEPSIVELDCEPIETVLRGQLTEWFGESASNE